MGPRSMISRPADPDASTEERRPHRPRTPEESHARDTRRMVPIPADPSIVRLNDESRNRLIPFGDDPLDLKKKNDYPRYV